RSPGGDEVRHLDEPRGGGLDQLPAHVGRPFAGLADDPTGKVPGEVEPAAYPGARWRSRGRYRWAVSEAFGKFGRDGLPLDGENDGVLDPAGVPDLALGGNAPACDHVGDQLPPGAGADRKLAVLRAQLVERERDGGTIAGVPVQEHERAAAVR